MGLVLAAVHGGAPAPHLHLRQLISHKLASVIRNYKAGPVQSSVYPIHELRQPFASQLLHIV